MSELYDLPKGWEWKTLNDIFLIQRGGSPRPIKDYITDEEDGINWIKIGDTKEGEKYIYKTKEKIRKEGLKKSRLVTDGDFILSNSMSFGRPYIVKTEGAIHDGWLLMRDKLENISKDYFYYLLSSDYMYQQFSNKAAGTAVKNLNINLVKSTDVPLPKLTEQQRIVAKLDKLFEKIDKAIALHQKNIDEANAFMGSALNEVFGELEEKYGKTAISDAIDKDGLDMGYVKHYFLSPPYLSKVMINCSGARMPRLTTKFLKSDDAYIPIPSISIQQKVVTYLDDLSIKIEKVKSIQKEKMDSLKALKSSILDKAFRGEL